ncbi:MAG: TrbG/VirB9 family P-type conjugative transfer protein [Vulcanimicrobiaceae bacterium]
MRRVSSFALALALLGSPALAGEPDAHFVSVPFLPDHQATIVCPVNMLCTVRLETGEHVRDGLNSQVPAWDPCATSGDASKSCSLITQGDTPILVFRPVSAGLKANVVVTTDTRTYFILLKSVQGSSPTYFSFQYPRRVTRPVQAPLTVPQQLALACSWQATNAPRDGYDADAKPAELRPVRVCHDKEHTWLALPPLSTVPDDMPVLHELTPDGERLVNYNVFASDRIIRIDGVGFGYVLRGGGKDTMHVHRIVAPAASAAAATPVAHAPSLDTHADGQLQAILGGHDAER